MNCFNKTKIKYVVQIISRAALRIASKFGDLQELVRILRDKEQLKLKRIQRENERLLKSMDNQLCPAQDVNYALIIQYLTKIVYLL